jgi:heptosyltransferase-1
MCSSILLIKTSAIGDVIQTFPVLEYLRAKFPLAQIDWVAEQGIAPLLRAHPLLNNVLEVRTKAWRKEPFSASTRAEFIAFVKELRRAAYDLAIDLQGNTKSAVVTGSAKAAVKLGYSWKSVREKSNLIVTNKWINVDPDLNVRLKYLRLVQDHFGDAEPFVAQGVRLNLSDQERERLERFPKKQPRIMVCFGSKWANKRLDETTLRALLQKIAAEYDFSFMFIYGDEEEKKVADAMAATFGERGTSVGNLSLPLWQALMWECDGVIAVDSAALHLCGTTQTPSFSVFGPSLATSYKPMENRHLAVQGTCPYGRTFVSRCPILRTCETGACMRNINADELFESFRGWVKVINYNLILIGNKQ